MYEKKLHKSNPVVVATVRGYVPPVISNSARSFAGTDPQPVVPSQVQPSKTVFLNLAPLQGMNCFNAQAPARVPTSTGPQDCFVK